ncbi:MAG: hypothetical protein SFT81_04825 [Candidatus Caenarcaniphilales bacterium]|nr:hypothetical protein [Candidatus Caenarcaniphilales bacterium]
MIFDSWEGKYRQHWPHHYRDILDKLKSVLGMVVVSDTHNLDFSEPNPTMVLQRSFCTPPKYQIIVQGSKPGEKLCEYVYPEEELEKAVLHFSELIGGWGDKPY